MRTTWLVFQGYCYRQEWCALFSCFIDIGDVGIMCSSSIVSSSVDVLLLLLLGCFLLLLFCFVVVF